MTVRIYVNTAKQVGDKDHLEVLASDDVAETWLQENDLEGVAFEYEVLEWTTSAEGGFMRLPRDELSSDLPS